MDIKVCKGIHWITFKLRAIFLRMWGFVFNEVFQLKLSQKVFYLIVFWYYMWFFWSLQPHQQVWMTNIQSTKLQILADQLWCHGWQTCDLPHWHSSSLIKHFVVKRGPLSLGIRSHTCRIKEWQWKTAKQSWLMTLWAHFETDVQQRHKSEAVALGSEYYAHIYLFFSNICHI